MKLYIMDCGVCNLLPPHYLGLRKSDGTPFTIPVPAMLIEHPDKGAVLVDTSFNNDHLPEPMRNHPATVAKPEQELEYNLAQIGYKPEDIRLVIMTHLHVDHSGCMELFNNARFIVRKSEYEYACSLYGKGDFVEGYLFRDFAEIPEDRYLFVEDDADYDVFGDDSIVLIDTKGHTAGHQSVLISLSGTDKMLLAADAVQLREDLDTDEFMKGGCWSTDCFKNSQKKVQTLVKQDVKLVYGHDPELWETLRLSPAYYK